MCKQTQMFLIKTLKYADMKKCVNNPNFQLFELPILNFKIKYTCGRVVNDDGH